MSTGVERLGAVGSPVHDNHLSNELPQPGFNQKWYIQNANLMARQPMFGHAPYHRSADGRVNNCVQLPSLPFVREDNLPQFRTIQGTIWLEDSGSKLRDDLCQSPCARGHDFAGYYVGIDDGDIVRCE